MKLRNHRFSLILTVSLAAMSASALSAQAQLAESTARQSRDAAAAAVATEPANPVVYKAGRAFRGAKIMISTNERRLRLIVGSDTLLDAPVAIGMGTDFEYEGKMFRFETPTGRRKVLGKAENPIWTVPEWHYMEKAKARDLQLVRLKADDRIELTDGSFLVVVDDQVGRINQFGNFWAFTPGTEIVFDGKIFMPPMNTAQRRVPGALGPYKLDMGEGYLIHGTHYYNTASIGEAVSHGCVRLSNEDVDKLYWMVDAGTPVFIY